MESWDEKRERLFNRDNLRCRRCQRQTSSLSLHHIIPRELHGTDEDDNLITLCDSCHDWVELHLAFEPLLRTRVGIMNSLPSMNYKVIPSEVLQVGYPKEGDRADIWSMWIKAGRKGAKELIVKYGHAEIMTEYVKYKPKLSTATIEALPKPVKRVLKKGTMTREEYDALFGKK